MARLIRCDVCGAEKTVQESQSLVKIEVQIRIELDRIHQKTTGENSYSRIAWSGAGEGPSWLTLEVCANADCVRKGLHRAAISKASELEQFAEEACFTVTGRKNEPS